MKQIKMYGTQTCSDCRRSKAFLDGKGIAYEFIDIAVVEGAAEEIERLTGRKKTPTIVISDGTVLVEPLDEELEKHI